MKNNRIKELIEYLNISQIEFSRITGFDKSTVSLYVNGKREPMQDAIYIISQKFNIDPAWLLGFDVPIHRVSNIKEITSDTPFMEKVEMLHKLSPSSQEIVFNQIDFLYSKENC